MGITQRFDDQRNRTALSRAKPYLQDDEEVVGWVRVRHSTERKEGFAYITPQRLLVAWGRSDGHDSYPWSEVVFWGVERGSSDGPILCVESETEATLIKLPARSKGVATRVKSFLKSLARAAPTPTRSMSRAAHGNLEAADEIEVAPPRRSAWGMTRRVAITVIGVALIVLAVLIIPVPGPWSILLTIGGLAVLASEYDWAKDVQDWMRDKYQDARQKIRDRKNPENPQT